MWFFSFLSELIIPHMLEKIAANKWPKQLLTQEVAGDKAGCN